MPSKVSLQAAAERTPLGASSLSIAVAIVMALCPLRILASKLPVESSDRDWEIASLLRGSRLAGRNLFNLSFETDEQGKVKRIWVAASNGLHSYNGFHWQQFGKANGLPSDFVRSVLVTRDHLIWVGTDKGAGTFDGKRFVTHGSEKGLAGQNIRRIMQDRDGALWFCSDSWPSSVGGGGVARWRDGQWQKWQQTDGLPSDYVVNVFEDSKKRIFAATLDGLAELENNSWKKVVLPEARNKISWGSATFSETPGLGMVLSTGKALFFEKDGKWKLASNLTPHEFGVAANREGELIACGSTGPHRKAFVKWTGNRWKQVSADFPVRHDYVEDVVEGPDGAAYALGFDCLQRWQPQSAEWEEFAGVPGPSLADAQGAIWFTEGREMLRYKDGAWADFGDLHQTLVPGCKETVWTWNAESLSRWQETARHTYSASETGVKVYQDVRIGPQGEVWVIGKDARQQEKVAVFDGSGWHTQEVTSGRWSAGTPDPVAGAWFLVQPAKSGPALLRVGRDVSSHAVPPQLLSEFTNSIYADLQGNIWLYGDSGLSVWKHGTKAAWSAIPNLAGRTVLACLERAGELWFVLDGTTGGTSALLKFARGQWKTYAIDPISSWSKSADQTLLFGSKDKFYLVPAKRDAEPIPVRLPEPDQVLSILKDERGTYWLGTDQGIFIHRPRRESPQTRVLSFQSQVLAGEKLRVRAQGLQYFEPAGRSLNFWYSWRIDGGRWSEFDPRAERTFQTAGLAAGEHRMDVRARNNELIPASVPSTIAFQVHDLPIQERRWFLPAMLLTAALLVGLVLMAALTKRELVLQAESLEATVAERTEELQRANAVLQRANEDLRQFGWAASHDLQEPLRMVVSFTQFLARSYAAKLDDKGREYMGFAVKGAIRMQTLLAALREYWQVSEQQTDQLVAVNANRAVETALTHLQVAVAESGATVFCEQLPVVQGNEIALVQLFQNLIGNAIKYRKPEGRPEVRVSATRNGTNWEFSIQDNGIGIAPEHQEIIFAIFKRLNGDNYAGAGIGLAICERIVRRLGGKIWVESEYGQGSCFTFTIPVRVANNVEEMQHRDGRGQSWRRDPRGGGVARQPDTV